MTAAPDRRTFSATEIDEIKRRAGLVETIGRVVELTGEGGGEHRGLCPFHNERTPSFTVNPKKGFAHCFGCGWHGDVINFVMAIEKLDFPQATRRLADGAGYQPPASPKKGRPTLEDPARLRPYDPDQAAKKAAKVVLACEIWSRARVLDDTLAPAVYLRGRGIIPARLPGRRWPPSLRFSSSEKYFDAKNPARDGTFHPAMIAAVQHYDPVSDKSFLRGIHRTYLARRDDGSVGKAFGGASKKMLGEIRGGAIRFAPAAATLGLAEGIETALAVLAARPPWPVWAAGDMGKMAQVILPPAVREVVLLMDSDTKDLNAKQKMLARAADHYGAAGIKIKILAAPDGTDFNDVLCAEGARFSIGENHG